MLSSRRELRKCDSSPSESEVDLGGRAGRPSRCVSAREVPARRARPVGRAHPDLGSHQAPVRRSCSSRCSDRRGQCGQPADHGGDGTPEPLARRGARARATGRSRSSTRSRCRCTSRPWRSCARTKRRWRRSCARTTASTTRSRGIEAAAPPDERALIQQIRAAQDDAMAIVADIANFIRDGKVADAMTRCGHPAGAALPDDRGARRPGRRRRGGADGEPARQRRGRQPALPAS